MLDLAEKGVAEGEVSKRYSQVHSSSSFIQCNYVVVKLLKELPSVLEKTPWPWKHKEMLGYLLKSSTVLGPEYTS